MNPGSAPLTPQRVSIIRPKLDRTEAFGRILGGIGGIFFTAWLVTLLLGTLTDWGFGYWHTLGVIATIRLVLPNEASDYRYWTVGSGFK